MNAMRIPIVLLFLVLSSEAADSDAESLMANGHWKRARALAEAVYKAHPNDARANYLMARVRREFKSLDEAAKYGEAAVRLDPRSSAYHRELGKTYFDQVETASIFTAIGLAKKCRAELETAQGLSAHDPDTLFDLVAFHIQAPGMAGGDKKKASDIAQELVKIDPVRGYLALMYIARHDRDDTRLEGLCQKAVEVGPRNYDAQIAFANYYLAAQHANPIVAEQHARMALEINSDRVEAYRELAAALVLEKRYEDVTKLMSRAEAAVPDDLSPYVTAARVMLRDEAELPRAETYLQKYLNQTKEQEPNAPLIAGVHRSLGLVFEKEGRRADARMEMETAVRLKPDFEQAKQDLKRLK
jgi:tetratricopeptide (TPR) repeat protein